MFVHTLQKSTIQRTACATAALGATGILLLYSQAMTTGINRGLSICTAVIIPTLYPFMLLAGWLTDSPLCRRPGRWMTAVTRRLFGLPGCCGPAILLSLVGGYPAGVLAIARLQSQGQIDREQTRRMTAFCVNGGPGFIIGTVGGGLLGSTQAGVVLCAAHLVVSIGIGIWLGRGQRRPEKAATSLLPPARPVAQIVADTCSALLTMCGFVILATTVLSLWDGIGLSRRLYALIGIQPTHSSAVLAALLEVSCGCIALAGSGSLAPLWLSLCMSWSGLSVQGQLAAAMKEQRLLTPYFWTWRLLHGILSGAVSLLLFQLFPVRIPTSSLQPPTSLPYSVSALASFMLLGLSFLTMLCFSGKSTGKIE